MSGAQSLADLKAYFKTNATLNTMNKTSRGSTKCVMCLSNRQQRRGYEAWFLLRWNVLSEHDQYDFRVFIGRQLTLHDPSLFRVGVRVGSPRVVVFYIEPLLQTLANDWFHPRPAHRYRLEDALDILHNPQPADNLFRNLAYGT
jgi:hypothetical protein